MGITDEQFKEAARKAYAAGDVATARSLLARVSTQQAPMISPEERAANVQSNAGVQSAIDAATLQGMQPPQGRGAMAAIGDNLFGYDDGVQSYGESAAEFAAPVLNWANRAVESASLGLLGDEYRAGVQSIFPGANSYDANLAREREAEANMSMGAQLSADVAGGMIPTMLGVGAVNSATTLGGAALRGAGFGAGAGATQGWMEGEGGIENRGQSGVVGALLGGAMGGAVPLVGALGKQAVRSVSDGLRAVRVGDAVGGALNVDSNTGRVLADVIGREDPRAMADALNKAGPGAMLGDASRSAGRALDMAMQTPVPGAQTAARRIDDRAGNAYYGVMDALVPEGGPRQPSAALERGMRKTARGGISELYDQAYDTPINYASPEGRKIEELVGRLPSGTAAKAVRQATDEMIYDGMPNAQMMVTIGDNGDVAFKEMPNVQQLDYIKRAYDDIAEDSRDPITGALTSEGRFASRIARDIREATKSAVPVYGDALADAATDTRARGAVRAGASLLRPETTVEAVLETIDDATPSEMKALRSGLINQIEHVIGNVRAVASDQNVDAREALKLFSDLSSDNTKRKLQFVFGDQWPMIEVKLDEAGAALGLRARTSANSGTAGRQFAKEAVDAAIDPGALRRGEVVKAGRNLIGGVIGGSPEAIARAGSDVRSQLADVLTRQAGTPQQALSAIVKALADNPQNLAAGKTVEEIVRILGLGFVPAAVGSASNMMGGR